MIFFFSGTGNTRWAAETVARALGERLVNIADEMRGNKSAAQPSDAALSPAADDTLRYTVNPGESIGIFYPVHGWQPPAIVRKFIRRMEIVVDGSAVSSASVASRIPYVYSLCTCGDTVGDAMTILSEELAARGLLLNAAFSLVMPESYVCLPFMYTDTPEREHQKKATAAAMLEEIIPVIKARGSEKAESTNGDSSKWENGKGTTSDGHRLLKTGPTPRLYSYVIGAYFNRYMISDKKFTVDADKCISCGRCVAACPTGDIIMEEPESSETTSSSKQPHSTPTWLHNDSCTCCLACYHHCPTHAINYGSITRKRGQYYYKP